MKKIHFLFFMSLSLIACDKDDNPAPNAAMGAMDQRIYIIPGKNMVVVRMGNASDPANPDFAVSGFDNELWEKINAVIN